MKILIIGNGFDLQHGLPMKYTDFLKQVKTFSLYILRNRFIDAIEQGDMGNELFVDAFRRNNMQDELRTALKQCKINMNDKIIDTLDNSKIFSLYINESIKQNSIKDKFFDTLKQNNIKDKFINTLKQNNMSEFIDALDQNDMKNEFSEIVSNNAWLAYFIQQYENGVLKGENWIDFEREISDVIADFERQFLEDHKISINYKNNNFYIHLTNAFRSSNEKIVFAKDENDINIFYIIDETLSAFLEFLYEELRELTRAFEIYCICTANRKNIPLFPLKEQTFDCVLSFNFTNTYEALYGKEGIKYCYINGLAQKDSSSTNMVFGIDDNLYSDKENTEFAFINFKKYFQRIVFKTGSEYLSWPKDPKDEVFIVGHSMDKTDHEILKEFFCREKPPEIKIFHHDQASNINLVKRTFEIIGKEELKSRVYGTSRNIIFINQYDEKDGLFEKR